MPSRIGLALVTAEEATMGMSEADRRRSNVQ